MNADKRLPQAMVEEAQATTVQDDRPAQKEAEQTPGPEAASPGGARGFPRGTPGSARVPGDRLSATVDTWTRDQEEHR